jgi:hypothetical protein
MVQVIHGPTRCLANTVLECEGAGQLLVHHDVEDGSPAAAPFFKLRGLGRIQTEFSEEARASHLHKMISYPGTHASSWERFEVFRLGD